jgi:hypothetical protein
MTNLIVKRLLSLLIAPDRSSQQTAEDDEARSVRAERFRAYVVPCTFESELRQLEDDLQSGAITFGEFVTELGRLKKYYLR